MRYLLMTAVALALAGCAEPIPAYAPYESEGQRAAVLEKVRSQCEKRDQAESSCQAFIHYRENSGAERYGIVRSVDANGFTVMWMTPEGYTNPLAVPLESPQFPGVIVDAAPLKSEQGGVLMQQGHEATRYDRIP